MNRRLTLVTDDDTVLCAIEALRICAFMALDVGLDDDAKDAGRAMMELGRSLYFGSKARAQGPPPSGPSRSPGSRSSPETP